MKLKENENIIAEYTFGADRNQNIRSILTSNRLVFINNESEEHYPLSKITSVKIDKKENGFRSKILGFAILIAIGILIYTGVLIFNESTPDWNSVLYLLPVYLILFFLIKFGLKPDKIITSLVISQIGGTKKYTATLTNRLQDFIDRINECLI